MCSVSRAVRIALHRRQRQRGKILVALPAAGLRVPLWSTDELFFDNMHVE